MQRAQVTPEIQTFCGITIFFVCNFSVLRHFTVVEVSSMLLSVKIIK